jgi:hypothetical protein
MTAKPHYDAFMSYRRSDRRSARGVRCMLEGLRAAGADRSHRRVNVFIDEDELPAGGDLPLRLY